MAIHCSILAWRIPRTEEPDGPPSMGVSEADPTEGLKHRKERLRRAQACSLPLSLLFSEKGNRENSLPLLPFPCNVCVSVSDGVPSAAMERISTVYHWPYLLLCEKPAVSSVHSAELTFFS